MQQDINKKFKGFEAEHVSKMPSGHEARFLLKLDADQPIKRTSNKWFYYIAASVMLFLSCGLFLFNNKTEQPIKRTVSVEKSLELKSLGDVSPELKQVENYYLASINLELSKMSINSNNKELFDTYLDQLENLNVAYKNLSKDLTQNGPTEVLVTALIENLKLRLETLQRLKNQLKEMNQNFNSNTII